MDPAVITALGKLVGLGVSFWNAHEKHHFSPEHMNALKALLDAGAGMAQPSADKTPIGVHHFLLVVSAFGEALKRHWYHDEHYAPGSGWWAWLKTDRFGRARMDQIETRMRMAAPRFKEVGHRQASDELAIVSSLVGDPVSTPYYAQLYGAFADESVAQPGEEPLIVPARRLQFEKHFRLAYAEGLTSARGEQIRTYLMALKGRRTEMVRELLVRDIAGWGDRHAFWNADGQDDLPRMPLGGMYVEPSAGAHGEPKGPVLTLLRSMLEQHPVTVLRADFGHGKSLTARMLAWTAALSYLETPSPSPELWRPVFVRCADDFQSPGDELDKVLRRALWRQAQGLRLRLPLHDDVFDPWQIEGRTLVLIDGLDELSLGEQQVTELFRQMREQSSDTRRFIVFTRPAALGRGEGLAGVPILDLSPFTTRDALGRPGGQVDEWLSRWSTFTDGPLSPTAAELEARSLLHIAKTPILLFMIADSWHAFAVDRPSLGDVYEGFFRDIARGKHEKDRDRNKPIAEASKRLRDRLREKGWLPHDADPPEAMLWLMSRVAWEMKCLEDAAWLAQRREPFDAFHARLIVRRELEMDDGDTVARTIQLGLLLAMQANLEEGAPRFLFGHKSFRDFLVGRYWAMRLRVLIRDESPRWELDPMEPLLGGRLLGGDDESYRFLRDHLARWPEQDRQRLARWAQRCFDEERTMDGATAIRSDRRPLLREAALAISAIVSPQGITARDERTLLSLLAWFWVQQVDPIIRAPRLQSKGARLAAADLRGAFLLAADLTGAHLAAADLGGAVLARARLRQANLHEARLRGADLRRADLRDAVLSDSDLRNADLRGADLRGADLRGAKLRGANLRRARLHEANLAGADYDARQIEEARGAEPTGHRPPYLR